jgi:hypothetical protein
MKLIERCGSVFLCPVVVGLFLLAHPSCLHTPIHQSIHTCKRKGCVIMLTTVSMPLKSPRQLSLPPSLPLGCQPPFARSFSPLILRVAPEGSGGIRICCRADLFVEDARGLGLADIQFADPCSMTKRGADCQSSGNVTLWKQKIQFYWEFSLL